MKGLWTFLGESFCDTGRYIKGVHKAGNRTEYEVAVRMLFANCDLQPLKDGLPHSVITAGTAAAGMRHQNEGND